VAKAAQRAIIPRSDLGRTTFDDSPMTRRPTTIRNRLGLHARAAAKLVTQAAAFKSEIYLERNEQQVDAKSIMGLMMLAASKGTDVTIVANGCDEHEAVESLARLIEERFGEEN
jgi:phosphocarrier protein HPr